MHVLKVNRLLAGAMVFCHLLVSLVAVLPANALAQTTESDPPEIQLEMVDEGARGDNQVFTATVTHSTGVESVTLHYRMADAGDYQSLDMSVLASTDIYTASVETRGMDATIIQYYIEARDAAGNRSIRGFAFDPLQRELVDSTAVAAQSTTAPANAGSGKRKILYGVLGLVVLAGLAAAAGGDNDSGGNQGAAGPDVPVRIIVDTPN
ncbi:MAG: hypothetical protein V3U76_00705 [Granulosicoccus sp.]